MPNHGGVLAFKAFLASFLLSILTIAAMDNQNAAGIGVVASYAAGAAYIIFTLKNWEKNKQTVRGAVIGWIVASLQILLCIGSLAALATNAMKRTSGIPIAHPIPAKYDEAKEIIRLCGRPSADHHPQELGTGVQSEGRTLVYRRYQIELWFYRGPESTQWMFVNAWEPNTDDAISVQEANTRMPCLKGTLQEHFREPRNPEEKAAVEAAQLAAQKF